MMKNWFLSNLNRCTRDCDFLSNYCWNAKSESKLIFLFCVSWFKRDQLSDMHWFSVNLHRDGELARGDSTSVVVFSAREGHLQLRTSVGWQGIPHLLSVYGYVFNQFTLCMPCKGKHIAQEIRDVYR